MTESRRNVARMGTAAALLAGSVFLSRVVGYLRDVALANQLGAGPETDAYLAAFQLPDLLNYLVAGGAFSISFLPLYARVREARGAESADRLFATVLGTLGAAVTLAVVALWVGADQLVAWIFPSFDDSTRALTVRLTRIVLPAQIFFVTGGIVRAVLMSDGRFGAQALSPLIYNFAIIAGGVATGDAEGFAWGVLVGSVLGPFGVPILDLRRTHPIRARIAFLDGDFRSYLWTALPLMIGLSLATVDEWFDRIFGQTQGAGAISHLVYARKLMQAPVAVVGQAMATAALPTLAHLFSSGRRRELDETLLRTLQAALGLGIFAAVAAYVFATPLVELVYHHGNFSAEAARTTALLLAIMSIGIPAWVVQQVAVRAFYAREDTWRPMLLGTAITVFAIPLYWEGNRRFGVAGLAAAGAIAMTINALATLLWARIRHGAPDLRALGATGLRAAGIAAVAGVATVFVLGESAPSGQGEALVDLAVGGIAYAALLLPAAWWLGDEAIRSALARILERLRRKKGSGDTLPGADDEE